MLRVNTAVQDLLNFDVAQQSGQSPWLPSRLCFAQGSFSEWSAREGGWRSVALCRFFKVHSVWSGKRILVATPGERPPAPRFPC